MRKKKLAHKLDLIALGMNVMCSRKKKLQLLYMESPQTFILSYLANPKKKHKHFKQYFQEHFVHPQTSHAMRVIMCRATSEL